MNLSKLSKRVLPVMALGALAGISLNLTACDEVTELCDLSCDENGYVEGRASISGVASIDAFFGASLELEATMTGLAADIRTELDGMAALVDLPAGSGGAEIAAALNAEISANATIEVNFQPPRCEVSVEASAQAAASCDVEVDPGMATVSCQGSCEVEAGVMVDCGAEASLSCTGQADLPNLECSGGCEGTCSVELSAAASCEGTCEGTCSGNCSLTNAAGECVGECDGMCEGTCKSELSGGASCSGMCEGSCTYEPGGAMAMCDASASASCEAMAGGSVECSGGCSGDFEPPSVSAECEATVEAKASASAECFPPELSIDVTFNAGLDASAQAEFNAFLEAYRGRLSAILALRARGDLIVGASADLVASAGGAVTGAIEELSASADIKATLGAACALGQIDVVVSGLGSASTSLTGEVSAAAEVTASIGG